MKIEFYNNNPMGFYNETIDIFLENEAQNAILIKNVTKFKNGEGADDWYCAIVKDDNGNIITSAMCTPPYNIAMYETGNKHDGEAINLLARELFNAGYKPPGVISEKVTAEIFAESYTKISGQNTRIHMSLNAMQLDKLADIKNFAPGYLREITREDLSYLPYWVNAFTIDCRISTGDIVESYEYLKNQFGKNTEYVWIDEIPVAMAGSVGALTTGTKIGRVYTPPFNRNKSYSTSCVWHLSKLLLDKGNKFVSLFADADYPQSNKVYQNVGFRNVCLYREIIFE